MNVAKMKRSIDSGETARKFFSSIGLVIGVYLLVLFVLAIIQIMQKELWFGMSTVFGVTVIVLVLYLGYYTRSMSSRGLARDSVKLKARLARTNTILIRDTIIPMGLAVMSVGLSMNMFVDGTTETDTTTWRYATNGFCITTALIMIGVFISDLVGTGTETESEQEE